VLSFTLIQQTRLILFTYHNNAPRCFLFVYTALSTSSQRIAALTSRPKLWMGNRTRPILSHTLRPLHLNSSKCRKRQSKFVNASTQCLVFLPICQASSQVLNQSPPQEKMWNKYFYKCSMIFKTPLLQRLIHKHAYSWSIPRCFSSAFFLCIHVVLCNVEWIN